jgi:hypothetical protein
MVNCHEMKKGQVYVCEECGLKLEVIEECRDCGTPAESCEHTECRFVCCDKELTLQA